MRKFIYSAALFAVAVFTSCSSSDDNYNKYADRSYGISAMSACSELSTALSVAYSEINNANLTEAQKTELQNILDKIADDVIVETYKQLGDAAVEMQDALGTLKSDEISQENIDKACTAFKKARKLWENSEAFLGGAASDFDIDPHIDSWPLNRDLLHQYLASGKSDYTEEQMEDATILGFHALEFILFRDGQNRKVAEFQGYDTYKGFTDIKGETELAYAEAVIADLVNHVFELQVAWQENPDATRLKAVQDAGLDYLVEKTNKSYGYNLKHAGNSSESTFGTLKAAIQQILSRTEGSCRGISDEVGTKKIANPFANGDVSYVESPYSYNSITDFANNIRSIENVWYGGMNGSSSNATYSFHKFFAENSSAVGKRVENAIADAIAKIEAMPYPFVNYCSTIWNVKFEDAELVEYPEEEGEEE